MEMESGLNRFEKIFYINLSYRTDRNALILNQLKKLGVKEDKIHRIEAIHDVLNGHRGCALSHITALKLALEMQLKEVLILEDDAFFLTNQEELELYIGYFLHKVPEYDILLLGGRIKESEPIGIDRIFRAKSSRRAHAYVIKSHYIPRLLSLFEKCHKKLIGIPFAKLTPNEIIIDHAWDELFQKDRVFFAKIFAHQRGGYSDIQHIQYDHIDEIEEDN